MMAKEEKALAIIHRLHQAGFKAYLAGGCVRDRLLGVEPKDYDLVTDARPEVVQQIFERTVAVGARFGVIVVIIEDDSFEVATFRADASYLDGRRPSAVRFGTIEEDALRRDFTIGGMYFDLESDKVIDLVGGRRDLRAGIIRAIGNVYDRFEEDRLRILRAIRFAARLGFLIDPATWTAIKRAAPTIASVSAERIGEELVMILTEGGAARGLDLMMECGLAETLLPEVIPLVGCEQPANFHPEGDVYVHTRLMLSMLPPACSETLAFGVLLHDIAKPQTRAEADGKVTYYGHTEQGALIAAAIMNRLRRSRAVQERVAYLVRYHLRLTMAPRMRPATLKRMLAEEGFEELLELSRIDTLASSSYMGFYNLCRRAMVQMGEHEIRPPRLVGGNDLIGLGFVPGPEFKTILKDVEDQQLDGAITTREAALEYVLSRYHPPQPHNAA
ncbi:MAG TPA: CCA tRNA nucleotidyltransferase [Candidatus Binataceae bacterium]|nr:CCA tRNA nucleotidyltransferase [Candidatus Binataceae bacterium]